MVVRGRQPELTELMLDGNVRLTEIDTADPSSPLVVSGEQDPAWSTPASRTRR